MSEKGERKEQLHELLKDFDTAMLVTRSTGGHMHARPMAVAELEPDADMYFVTAIDSPKMQEVESDPQVTVTFQGGGRFASVCGRVDVVRDRALIDKLWKEAWKVWFPKGKSDPQITLLKFDAEHGELWDGSGVQGVKYGFEAAKAYVQGERPTTDRKQHTGIDL